MTGGDFKTLAQRRLPLIEMLISEGEWNISAYFMGLVLECVLKAASCKTLNLTTYPEVSQTKNRQIADYFKTHNFDMLLTVSGTTDIFGFAGVGASSWSGFTQEYVKVGSWTNIRYETRDQFDEVTVKRLYRFLTEDPNGIIPLVTTNNKW